MTEPLVCTRRRITHVIAWLAYGKWWLTNLQGRRVIRLRTAPGTPMNLIEAANEPTWEQP